METLRLYQSFCGQHCLKANNYKVFRKGDTVKYDLKIQKNQRIYIKIKLKNIILTSRNARNDIL